VTSPVGSISEPDLGLVLKPVVLKTFIKGVIAIAVFSLFLQISPATIVNYLIFLAISLGLVGGLCFIRGRSRFQIDDGGIHIKRMFHRPNLISYDNIHDLTVSQGMLARRFNCGTVFIILNQGPGSVKIMGGGVAEKLEEVHNPNKVFEFVSSRLGPFGQSI